MTITLEADTSYVGIFTPLELQMLQITAFFLLRRLVKYLQAHPPQAHTLTGWQWARLSNDDALGQNVSS